MKFAWPKNKIVVCIFAHPDDESFGPGGTIATLSKTNDVYIICATNGDAGMNEHSDKSRSLVTIRQQELKNSSQVLGVKRVYFLNYQDGGLCNNVYHIIAKDSEKILNKLKPTALLTFEHRGLSGHLDHITISMIANFLFEKLDYIKTLLSYCLTKDQVRVTRAVRPHYFIYRPPGYPQSAIEATLDTSAVWSTRKKAIMAHHSQRSDMERIIKIFSQLPKKEYFFVRKK